MIATDEFGVSLAFVLIALQGGDALMGAARRVCVVVSVMAAASLVTSAGLAGPAFGATAENYVSAPPAVEGAHMVSRGPYEATVEVQINPEGQETSYHFEYGTTSEYGETAPVPDATLGAYEGARAIRWTFTGLSAATSYHYRVVASNASGTTEGADATFATFQAPPPAVGDSCPNALVRGEQFSSYLPDCRAYELVSPPDKSGGSISDQGSYTQSALDGNAIKYVSFTAFGDAEGTTTLGTEYVSQRAPDGSAWLTHGITPPQPSKAFQLFTSAGYYALSEDLTKGIFYSFKPVLSGYPNVEHNDNIYVRTDLLGNPPGHYELLSNALEPQEPRSGGSYEVESEFAAASSDWSRILFESIHDLTPEAVGLDPRQPKLYEWYEGTVKLAGILPDGKPAESSIAGAGTRLGISQDGQWTAHTISSDGSRVIFTVPQTGQIYMRIDGTSTIKINASERSPSNPDPNGEQPATYAASTADDSKIFFLSAEALTENAPADGFRKLYMYETGTPEGKHLTLISVDSEPNGSQGDYASSVAAISRDGDYVYFNGGPNDLVPGVPPFIQSVDGAELYVWHDGVIRGIARSAWYDGSDYVEAGWGSEVGRGNTVRVSADGKTAMFLTMDIGTAERVGYNNTREHRCEGTCLVKNGDLVCEAALAEECREAYVYSYDTNKLVCASCDPGGVRPVGHAGIDVGREEFDEGLRVLQPTQYLNRPLSSDGRYVFFDTPDPLVAQDTNGRRDVYEYDTLTGRLYLISSGTCNCDSRFVDASADGHDVFFTTGQQLVHSDIDQARDLYDARIEGGIPAQNQPAVVACAGEECQGPVPIAPALTVPASATFHGVGNPVSEPVRRQGKPAKKKKHKARHHPKRHRKKGKRSSVRLSTRQPGR